MTNHISQLPYLLLLNIILLLPTLAKAPVTLEELEQKTVDLLKLAVEKIESNPLKEKERLEIKIQENGTATLSEEEVISYLGGLEQALKEVISYLVRLGQSEPPLRGPIKRHGAQNSNINISPYDKKLLLLAAAKSGSNSHFEKVVAELGGPAPYETRTDYCTYFFSKSDTQELLHAAADSESRKLFESAVTAVGGIKGHSEIGISKDSYNMLLQHIPGKP